MQIDCGLSYVLVPTLYVHVKNTARVAKNVHATTTYS